MTTANKITIFRILLVPFFIVQLLYYVRTGDDWNWLFALLAFAFAALADGLDGYIARRYNQKSELGAILDPLADKLLLVSAIILLSLDHGDYFTKIPLWLTVTLISRDIIILIGFLVIHHLLGKTVVRTRITGKIATVFQMATVLWILFRWTELVVSYLVLGAAFFTALSGALYIFDGIRQLSASPTSAATKDQ
jgi:cardiolipin synthase (CMP-forming)